MKIDKSYIILIILIGWVHSCLGQLPSDYVGAFYQSGTTNRQKQGFTAFTNACPPLARYYLNMEFSSTRQVSATDRDWSGQYSFDAKETCDPITGVSTITNATGSYSSTSSSSSVTGSVDLPNQRWVIIGGNDTTGYTTNYLPISLYDVAFNWPTINYNQAGAIIYESLGIWYYGLSAWDYGLSSETMTEDDDNWSDILTAGSPMAPIELADYYGNATSETKLSSEYTTERLLTPFEMDPQIISGIGGASAQMWGDQSHVALNGSRVWFKLNGPKGRFEIPYVLQIQIPGLTNICETNFITCQGDGTAQCYPPGTGIAVQPPLAAVNNNCSTFYFGGTASLSLLNYMIVDDGPDKGIHCLTCVDCSSPGMPTWWVTEPYINLWIKDKPVQYTTSLGRKVDFTIQYKQRDTRPTVINGQTPFLPITGWNNNWYSYVHFVGASISNKDGTFNHYGFTNWTATVYEPGGGETEYSCDQKQDPDTGDRLLPLDGVDAHVYPSSSLVPGGGPNVYGGAGFRVVHPDGSQEIYGLVTSLYPTSYTETQSIMLAPGDVIGSSPTITFGAAGISGVSVGALSPVVVGAYSGASVSYADGQTNLIPDAGTFTTNANWGQSVINGVMTNVKVNVTGAQPSADAILTERIDPYGNAIHLNYIEKNGLYYLASIVDYDNQTTYLNYDTNGYLSTVSMPYSRVAHFQYNTNTSAQLLSVTDAQEMSSSFVYGQDGFISSMTTPYGITTFSNYEAQPGSSTKFNDTETRAIEITNPDQSREIYAYFDSVSNGVTQAYSSDKLPDANYWGGLDSGDTNYPASAMNLRNSFYWGRSQCAAITTTDVAALGSLTPHDFLLARMKHWKLGADGGSLGSALSMVQESSPDGVHDGAQLWYAYNNLSYPWQQSDDSANPSGIFQLKPDGTTWFEYYYYNDYGQPTSTSTAYTDEYGDLESRETYFQYTLVNYSENCAAVDGGNSWTASWLIENGGPGYQNSVDYYDFPPENLTVVTNRSGFASGTYTFTTTYPHWSSMVIGDRAGGTSKYYFNDREQLVGAVSPSGLTTTNFFGTDGFLSQSIALDIQATNTFTFSGGLLATRRDPNNLYTSYTWDNLERLTSIAYPDATTVSNVYARLNITGHKDRLNHWAYASYNNMRQMSSFTDYNGNTTYLDYCLCGGLDSVIDPQTNSTTYVRNLVGWVTNIVFADVTGHQTSRAMARDFLGRVTHVSDSSGISLDYTYNSQDLPTNITSPFGTIFAETYDYADKPVTMENAEGIWETNEYDNVEHLTMQSLSSGIFRISNYTVWQLTSTYDGLRNMNQFGYDAAGREVSFTDGNANTNGYTYTPGGKLATLTDGNGHVTSWGYDVYGHLIDKIDGNNVHTETNGYDADGRLTAHWTPAKGLTRYGYDNNGNLTSIAYSSGTNITATYDSLNRIRSLHDAVGVSAFTYQNFGAFKSLLATEDGPWASDTVSHTYVNGLPQSLTLAQPAGNWVENFFYDGLHRLKILLSPAGEFDYNYNGAGRQITTLSLPYGNSIVNTNDGAGQLLATTLQHGTTPLDYFGYSYDATGNRTSVTRMDNSYENYGYDKVGQLTGASAYGASGSLRGNENFGYQYDAAGNLFIRTNNTLIQTFTTDKANQLVNVTRNNNLLTLSGSLTNSLASLFINDQPAEIYHDLTFAATNGVALNDGLNTFTAVVNGTLTNTLMQVLPTTANLAYDSNGNLTSDGLHGFDYDCANELTRVTMTNQWKVEYAYDGFGRRRVRREYLWQGGQWLEANEKHYVYDGMRVIQERNLLNTPQVTYSLGVDMSGTIGGAGGIGGLLARTDANGNSAYYHTDGNGNVTMLVDAAGVVQAKYLYDSFGNMLGMWGALASANTYRYSSKEVDPRTGEYYYGYRYYEPNLQRWPNKDPLGEAGGINLYAYVRNNPINKIDPLGLWTPEEIQQMSDIQAANDSQLDYVMGNGYAEQQRRVLNEVLNPNEGFVMGGVEVGRGPVKAEGMLFGGKCKGRLLYGGLGAIGNGASYGGEWNNQTGGEGVWLLDPGAGYGFYASQNGDNAGGFAYGFVGFPGFELFFGVGGGWQH